MMLKLTSRLALEILIVYVVLSRYLVALVENIYGTAIVREIIDEKYGIGQQCSKKYNLTKFFQC